MDLKETFGFQRVSPDERRRRIRRLFDTVAPRYDLMNDLMSFGVHRWWKRRFVAMIGRAAPRARLIVDLAGGTGDVARLLRSRGARRVIVVDASLAMMRAGCAGEADEGISWVAAEGERLPFADATADVLSISFGLRNMADPDAALAEAARVLKPGGWLFCLEFSQPAWWLKPFYDLYSFHVIPRLGAWVAGEPAAYRYLVESIRRFPGQAALTEKIARAGFATVTWRDLSFGIAAVHAGLKGGAG